MCAYSVLKCIEIISKLNGRSVFFLLQLVVTFLSANFRLLPALFDFVQRPIAHEINICPANLQNSFTYSEKTPRVLGAKKFRV